VQCQWHAEKESEEEDVKDINWRGGGEGGERGEIDREELPGATFCYSVTGGCIACQRALLDSRCKGFGI